MCSRKIEEYTNFHLINTEGAGLNRFVKLENKSRYNLK
ncbi:hypothetical protein UF75_4703 [Desulfosporosinus sp. I2]|nr:hypothetical protein UF75_4703 [Desulfosporosinus sp. I2]